MFEIQSIHMTSHCVDAKDDATPSWTFSEFLVIDIHFMVFIVISGIRM